MKGQGHDQQQRSDRFIANIDTAFVKALRSESGNRTYIMTASRMTSGDVLKWRNGFGFLMPKI